MPTSELPQIALMRPRLPSAEKISTYLRTIDETRQYTNFGPLLRRFELRLAETMEVPEDRLVAVSSATSGLMLALSAVRKTKGAFCLMPSWTFAATPSAAAAAGLTPFFADVNEHTWALTPALAEAAMEKVPGTVAAVIPVAPFGAPIDANEWAEFARRTGVPVVIDAAAGFDSVQHGPVAVVLSLHATKPLGIGEGGLVITANGAEAALVRSLSNYGMPAGIAGQPGFNAKLSEYAAAVGLAALDEWPQARANFAALTATYRDFIENIPEMSRSPGFGGGWVSSTCNVRLPCTAAPVAANLKSKGVETRRWWGVGCHLHPAFAECPRADLSVTETLAERTLSLPFYRDLGDDNVGRVMAALAEALKAQSTEGAAS